jgi:hypothetical protein
MFFGFVTAAVLILVIIWWANNRPPNLRIPSHSLPAKNGYDNFVAAGKLAANIAHKSPASLGRENVEANSLAHLSMLVSELAPAHDQLRDGLKLECVQPPVRSPSDISRQLMALAGIRELCRELSGEALYYKESSQPGRAMQTLLDGAEMCAVFPRGGGQMGMPIGQMGICLAPMESLLGKLKPTELAHVAARLDHILKVMPSFGDIMREEADTETAIFISAAKEGAFSDYAAVLQTQRLTDNFGKVSRSALSDRIRAAGFMLANKSGFARMLHEYMNSLADEADHPYTGPSRVAHPDDMECDMDLWLYEMSRAAYLVMQARLILIRFEVALLEFRAAHGKFPSTLTELTSRYIVKLPDDPFAGHAGIPPIYRVNSSGSDYVMYSRGPNLIDNGGQPATATNALDANGNPTMPDSTGDIVAGKLFPPSPIKLSR